MFEQIAEEESERHPVEAIASFDDKLAIERDGQVKDAGEQHQTEDHRQAITQAIKPGGPEIMQPGEATAEGQDDEQGSVEQRRKDNCLVAVDRVIGGFLMRGERYARGEVSRYGVAVGGDETDVTKLQPEPGGQCQGKGEEKKEGEVWSHGSRCKAVRKFMFLRTWAIIWQATQTTSSGWTWK